VAHTSEFDELDNLIALRTRKKSIHSGRRENDVLLDGERAEAFVT
jgi:hypothetical protein